MNRKRVTSLSVAAAVLMAAVLMGSVWFAYFSGVKADFTLPPPLPSGSLPGTSATGPGLDLAFTPVSVGADNIQKLLETIERPEAYIQTVECVYLWPGGEESFSHTFARRGELTRVETRHGGHIQNVIVTPAKTYYWTGNAVPYNEISPEDAEAISGIPTWETVASLPRESVLSADYLGLPTGACLIVRTQEAVYQKEYIVSLETGLLAGAEFFNVDGQTAYRVTAAPPSIGDPGDTWFTFPDGKMAEGN
ncbi:MAG: hypothetical protein FWG31_08020 [Oscillospiraceae bacterium]|nr:hypothetical protein [Oscillospiraceae bacterium]